MHSSIRLFPQKKTDIPVVPYRRLVSGVLFRRFCASQRAMLFFDAAVAALLFPICNFFKTFTVLVTITVCINYLYKRFIRPEAPAYPSTASAIYHKLFSIQLFVSVVVFGFGAYLYFVFVAAPASDTVKYTVKEFKRYESMEGVPRDWALHQSFEMLEVIDSYLYGTVLSWGLALGFSVYLLMHNLLVFQTNNVPKGTKGLRFVFEQTLKSSIQRAFYIWCRVSLFMPIFHFIVVRKHYLLFAPYLANVGLKHKLKTLSSFAITKNLVIIPLLFLPLIVVWMICLDVFKLVVNTRPVSRWRSLSEFSMTSNKTLLDGIKENPDSVTALFAWNELLIIAEHNAQRRKTIYDDVDYEASTWKQIVSSATAILHGYNESLHKHTEKGEKSKDSAKEGSKESEKESEKKKNTTETGTTSSNKPAAKKDSDGDNLVREIFEKYGTTKKIYSTMNVRKEESKIFTPEEPILNPNSALEKKIHKFVDSLESRSYTRTEKARLILRRLYHSTIKMLKLFEDILLATYVGGLFRKTTDRALRMKLRHRQTAAFAIHAVARFMTHSLTEDEYGNVQDTIAPFLATIEQLSRSLEHVITNPPIDPTDVLVRNGVSIPDTSVALELLMQLNAGFMEICEVFSPYFNDINLNKNVIERSTRHNLIVSKSAYIE